MDERIFSALVGVEDQIGPHPSIFATKGLRTVDSLEKIGDGNHKLRSVWWRLVVIGAAAAAGGTRNSIGGFLRLLTGRVLDDVGIGSERGRRAINTTYIQHKGRVLHRDVGRSGLLTRRGSFLRGGSFTAGVGHDSESKLGKKNEVDGSIRTAATSGGAGAGVDCLGG